MYDADSIYRSNHPEEFEREGVRNDNRPYWQRGGAAQATAARPASAPASAVTWEDNYEAQRQNRQRNEWDARAQSALQEEASAGNARLQQQRDNERNRNAQQQTAYGRAGGYGRASRAPSAEDLAYQKQESDRAREAANNRRNYLTDYLKLKRGGTADKVIRTEAPDAQGVTYHRTGLYDLNRKYGGQFLDSSWQDDAEQAWRDEQDDLEQWTLAETKSYRQRKAREFDIAPDDADYGRALGGSGEQWKAYQTNLSRARDVKELGAQGNWGGRSDMNELDWNAAVDRERRQASMMKAEQQRAQRDQYRRLGLSVPGYT